LVATPDVATHIPAKTAHAAGQNRDKARLFSRNILAPPATRASLYVGQTPCGELRCRIDALRVTSHFFDGSLKAAKIAKISKFAKASARPKQRAMQPSARGPLGLAFVGAARHFSRAERRAGRVIWWLE
jgi:hypothetical protein